MSESSRNELVDIYSDGNIVKKVISFGSGPIKKRDDVLVKLKITQETQEIFVDDDLNLSVELQFIPQGLIDLLCTMEKDEIAEVTVKSEFFKANFSEYVPDILTSADLTVNLTIKEIKPIMDLYENGSFFMRFMEKTAEINSSGCTRARIQYKLEINNFTYLDNTEQVPMQVLIPDIRLPELWNFAISHMKQGEQVRIECDLLHDNIFLLDNGADPNYNISTHRPSQSKTAYLYLKVATFDTGILTDCMSTAERSEAALRLKDEGNVFFSANNLEKAVEFYKSALATLEPISDDPGVLRMNCATVLGNLTLVFVKIKSWTVAEEFASKVLEINSSDVKALYRRGLARIGNNRLDAALDDLKSAKEIAAANGDNNTLQLISKEIAGIHAEFKRVKESEKAKYKNLFK